MQDNMENTEKKDTGYHLYGMHPVLEAVLSGRQIEKVLLKQGLEGQQFRQLLTELDSRGIPFQFVPAERLARFRGGRNQGVVAYLPQIDYMPLEEMVERAFQKDWRICRRLTTCRWRKWWRGLSRKTRPRFLSSSTE